MIDNYHKILVGIDGSVESTKAFDKAVAIALRNDAELILVNVIDLRAYQSLASYGSSVLADDTQRGAENLINDFAEDAKVAGVTKIKTRVEFGSPKVMIGQTLPKEEEADLIVLGATGLSYVERIFIGSVAQYIISRAPCDALIVRN
ncbi:universal stress protein [Lactovum miscens]|uniref:Universal stress protein n=1 Tax=Lactovum miscens TaxID=190387 RepID=A0A841C7E8_9LACT|nr:universal stress protein [Lactovum miscens]MBB5887512.1 nucleotide-binding universal stress UspA family protein [Lactovum miscens]